MTNEKYLMFMRMLFLIAEIGTTQENLPSKFKQWMDNFLARMRENHDGEEIPDQQQDEIAFLENNAVSKTLSEWFELFCHYYETGHKWVCVWIINQGYMGAVSDILNCEEPRAKVLLTRQVNKLTTEQHERVKEYIAAVGSDRTIDEWIQIGLKEDDIVAKFILDSIIVPKKMDRGDYSKEEMLEIMKRELI